MTAGRYALCNVLPSLSLLNANHCAARDAVSSGQVRLQNDSPKRSYLSNFVRRHLRPDASLHVDCVRHWFEVVRVYTRMIAAKMIDLQSIIYRTAMFFPRNPMRQYSGSILANSPVSHSITVLDPVPASGIRVNNIVIRRNPDWYSTVMAFEERNRASLDPSLSSTSVPGGWRHLPTTAHTKTTGVRFRNGKLGGHLSAPHTSRKVSRSGAFQRRPASCCSPHFTTNVRENGGKS